MYKNKFTIFEENEIYKLDISNKTYYYKVNYDLLKLTEVYNLLQRFNYRKTETRSIKRNEINSIFNSRKSKIRNTINYFNDYLATSYKDSTIIPESINLNNRGYITFDFSYLKNLDITHEIDKLLPHSLNERDYRNLFYYKSIIFNSIMDNILNYSSSDEFKERNLDNIEFLKLYKKILSCFNFKLIAIKENISNNNLIDGNELINNNRHK